MTTTRAALEKAKQALEIAGDAIDSHSSEGCGPCTNAVDVIAQALALIAAELEKDQSNG